MLRDQAAVEALIQEACPRGPYVDPVLAGSLSLYADFLHGLWSRNMVVFKPLDKSTRPIGLFWVAKRSGMQRLIFDTRMANY